MTFTNNSSSDTEKCFSPTPMVILPATRVNTEEIPWTQSYFEDQLYLEMCGTCSTVTVDVGTNNERQVNWYYFEAAKYAFRRSAGDFSGENAKRRPVFRLNRVDFSVRLKTKLAKLPKDTIHRIITEAVFRIFRARHKMIFHQYIENERLKWEFD
jgi:hypothetical protein